MIIAIVPAPGHEALVAEGPRGERPATIVRHRGSWVPWPAPAIRSYIDTRPVALVLHAPGDPKLGMLRAMEAADLSGLGAAYGDSIGVRCWAAEAWKGVRDNERGNNTYWDIPEPPPVLGIATDHTDWSARAAAFALAHLLVQRGIAAEVLVLPADKAKE